MMVPLKIMNLQLQLMQVILKHFLWVGLGKSQINTFFDIKTGQQHIFCVWHTTKSMFSKPTLTRYNKQILCMFSTL